MAENLNFGTRVSGTNDQGNATSTSAQKYCYSNNESNCTTYGGLYQWHTATAQNKTCDNNSCSLTSKHRGICPSGWHLPSRSEWSTLNSYVDSNNGGSSNDAGKSLKSKNLWNSGAGTDAFGWTGLPAGNRGTSGSFGHRGSDGYWWVAAQAGATFGWTRDLYSSSNSFTESNTSGPKTGGFSVRCVKD